MGVQAWLNEQVLCRVAKSVLRFDWNTKLSCWILWRYATHTRNHRDGTNSEDHLMPISYLFTFSISSLTLWTFTNMSRKLFFYCLLDPFGHWATTVKRAQIKRHIWCLFNFIVPEIFNLKRHFVLLRLIRKVSVVSGWPYKKLINRNLFESLGRNMNRNKREVLPSNPFLSAIRAGDSQINKSFMRNSLLVSRSLAYDEAQKLMVCWKPLI